MWLSMHSVNVMHRSARGGVVWVSCQKECVIWNIIVGWGVAVMPAKQITARMRLLRILQGWPVRIKIFVPRSGRESVCK